MFNSLFENQKIKLCLTFNYVILNDRKLIKHTTTIFDTLFLIQT